MHMAPLIEQVHAKTYQADPLCDGAVSEIHWAAIRNSNWQDLRPFIGLFATHMEGKPRVMLTIESSAGDGTDSEVSAATVFMAPFVYRIALLVQKSQLRGDWQTHPPAECVNFIEGELVELLQTSDAMDALKTLLVGPAVEPELTLFQQTVVKHIDDYARIAVNRITSSVEAAVKKLNDIRDGSEDLKGLHTRLSSDGVEVDEALMKDLKRICVLPESKQLYLQWKAVETFDGNAA